MQLLLAMSMQQLLRVTRPSEWLDPGSGLAFYVHPPSKDTSRCWAKRCARHLSC